MEWVGGIYGSVFMEFSFSSSRLAGLVWECIGMRCVLVFEKEGMGQVPIMRDTKLIY